MVSGYYIIIVRPRTEVSSLLIVQPAAKIQSPDPRWIERRWPHHNGAGHPFEPLFKGTSAGQIVPQAARLARPGRPEACRETRACIVTRAAASRAAVPGPGARLGRRVGRGDFKPGAMSAGEPLTAPGPAPLPVGAGKRGQPGGARPGSDDHSEALLGFFALNQAADKGGGPRRDAQLVRAAAAAILPHPSRVQAASTLRGSSRQLSVQRHSHSPSHGHNRDRQFYRCRRRLARSVSSHCLCTPDAYSRTSTAPNGLCTPRAPLTPRCRCRRRRRR